ncbi:adenylosuccinate synthetase [Anaerobaca lacustris]|uniref:Adenylosuccinate synthetase n=1 Tax=Anaerobaca lacustris TaxID=3044600 RepID=A0AAW6TW29_9BACT|nr:adenylosuccinate synthetase [Sedimentisphaerales bacterium M17dextr]
MSVTVVVGGQYGGEGKGKITSYLAVRDNADFVVRCGGPNSGHTVDYQGRRFVFRQLPVGVINPKTRLLIAPGAIVNPKVLLDEIEAWGLERGRLGIDYKTGVITETESLEEEGLALRERLGSTLSGMGRGVAKRVLRDPEFKRVEDTPELKEFVTDVSEELNDGVDQSKAIIIEGTQGFGLSLYHSPDYPYVTSRDTTASAFLSEVGLSPRTVTDIIMAIRTFPIRVGGNSGPLASEITWEELQQTSGYPEPIQEFTSVTKRLRRIGRFDLKLVQKARAVNRPTQIAVLGTDYFDYRNRSKVALEGLSADTKVFIEELETQLDTPVPLVGTGPANEELIDRRAIAKTTVVGCRNPRVSI